jgi:hypothetical protein
VLDIEVNCPQPFGLPVRGESEQLQAADDAGKILSLTPVLSPSVVPVRDLEYTSVRPDSQERYQASP